MFLRVCFVRLCWSCYENLGYVRWRVPPTSESPSQFLLSPLPPCLLCCSCPTNMTILCVVYLPFTSVVHLSESFTAQFMPYQNSMVRYTSFINWGIIFTSMSILCPVAAVRPLLSRSPHTATNNKKKGYNVAPSHFLSPLSDPRPLHRTIRIDLQGSIHTENNPPPRTAKGVSSF